jgi:hypothetical protein
MTMRRKAIVPTKKVALNTLSPGMTVFISSQTTFDPDREKARLIKFLPNGKVRVASFGSILDIPRKNVHTTWKAGKDGSLRTKRR